MKTDQEIIQAQKHEIDLLRGQLETMRQDLNDARNNWESAVEAMREADQALALGQDVQSKLVDALQGLMVKYTAFIKEDGVDRRLEAARAALKAAGVEPWTRG
jgi:predicted  nucleic acid-binding Zn-ribbon protein